MSIQNTKNLNLNLVDYGTKEWHTYLNDNFNIIDEAIKNFSEVNIIVDKIEPQIHKKGQIWIDTDITSL